MLRVVLWFCSGSVVYWLKSKCFVDTVIKMGKDPSKPRGRMSSYAYFIQTCREEHKKKHPEASVNFSKFSKKCSERWKVGNIPRLCINSIFDIYLASLAFS